MGVFELVWVFVNKAMVSKGPRRRGNPGYPRLQAIRLLVYNQLKGIGTDKGRIRHLKKHRRTIKALNPKKLYLIKVKRIMGVYDRDVCHKKLSKIYRGCAIRRSSGRSCTQSQVMHT